MALSCLARLEITVQKTRENIRPWELIPPHSYGDTPCVTLQIGNQTNRCPCQRKDGWLWLQEPSPRFLLFGLNLVDVFTGEQGGGFLPGHQGEERPCLSLMPRAEGSLGRWWEEMKTLILWNLRMLGVASEGGRGLGRGCRQEARLLIADFTPH